MTGQQATLPGGVHHRQRRQRNTVGPTRCRSHGARRKRGRRPGDRGVFGPAAARRRRHRLRQRAQCVSHRACVRACRCRWSDARRPGSAETLWPHARQGSDLRRRNGAEDSRCPPRRVRIPISPSSRVPTCWRRTAWPRRSAASTCTRRRAPNVYRTLAAVACSLLAANIAVAEPIKVIVPTAPGGRHRRLLSRRREGSRAILQRSARRRQRPGRRWHYRRDADGQCATRRPHARRGLAGAGHGYA